MEAKIKQYIQACPEERQGILTNIHTIIIEEDKTVVPVLEPMMGKEMIIYKGKGSMKYGLANVKNYMSLHLLPMYGSNELYTKYKGLLSKAKFQKGCINFTTADEMPLEVVRQFIAECSKIDLLKIREEYLAQKKAIKKSKK
jgi:hypothetical protein